MSSLTGQPIYQYYGDLLTTTNSGAGLSTTLQPLQDGLGNSSTVQIATNAINFSRANGSTFQLDGVNLTATATSINDVCQADPIIPGMGGVTVPGGTTGQRPLVPHNGEIRYNTTLNALEAFQNDTWGNLQAGAVLGPASSVANNIVTFLDTSGKMLKDSGVAITSVPAPLAELGRSLVTDVQISGIDILSFGSSILNDIGLIYRQTDYVLGIFPNTFVGRFPNTVFGFATPSSADASVEITQGAFLLSRLTQTEINALIAVDGMTVYNTTTDTFNFHQNGSWVNLGSGAVLSVSGTANEITATGTTSVTLSIANNPTIPGMGGMIVPVGTTAQRAGSPTNGEFRYNTDLQMFEGYQNSMWMPFGTGGGSVTSITAGTNLTGGTITTSGTIALSDTITGLTSLESNALSTLSLSVLATGGVPGFVDFYNSANTHYVGFTAPAGISSNVTWTLPATDGTMNQVLSTNGTGTLSWATVGGGNTTAKYILQQPDAGLPNSQALSDLGSAGLLKINTSGIVQIAIPDTDYATEATLLTLVEAASADATAAAASATAAGTAAAAAAASAIAAAASAITAAEEAGAITGAVSAKFILQTPNSNIPNAQSLGALTTGLLKNTVSMATGVLSTASAGTDYYGPGAPTTIIDTGLAGSFFIGTQAGNGTLTGVDNVGIGYQCLHAITTANRATAQGYQAGAALTQGNDNTFFGYHAGNAVTTGLGNVLIGSQAGVLITTASDNTIVGLQAGAALTTSSSNSLFGYQSGNGLTTGTQNCATGWFSMGNTTSGSFNCFYGVEAGFSNVSGSNISAFGWQAAPATDTSSNICAFGASTFSSASTSSGCSAFGDTSGANQNNYTNCTFVGALADASNDGLTNATAIGYNAQVGASNSLVLGNGANVGIGTSTPNSSLHIVGGITYKRTPITISSGGTYTVLSTDYIIGITSLAAGGGTVMLPAPSAANTGQIFIIKDEGGHVSLTQPLHITVAGGALIDGIATQTTLTAYANFLVYCNGTNYNLW
jgi:hypothetical protein